MGSCCCCIGCCCADCAQGCKKWLGPQKVTKLFYFILVIVFVIPAIFVLFFLNRWTAFKDYFNDGWFNCPDTSGDAAFACIGSSAIFRLSLCLLILFFIMMLLMLPRRRLSMVLNESCFCIKYLMVVALFIGSLWINNSVFKDYSTACKYISILFMILQSIILIDLFYLAGIRMVKRYDNGQTQYACYLIVLSVIAEAIAIMMNVLGYVYFSKPEQDGCTSTLWVNVVTTILLIVIPVIQFLHFNPQNSLLTTALVCVFISYLSFISQFSYDGGNADICSRMSIPSFVADVTVSTFFFILTMYGSIMGGTGQVKVTRDGNLNNAMGVGDQEQQKKETYGAAKQDSNENLGMEVENEHKYTQTFDWVKWHFYMCLASIYIAMLITNWGSANVDRESDLLDLEPSNPGFWIRLIISWAASLLYIWTMIAPRVCPSRDFTVE